MSLIFAQSSRSLQITKQNKKGLAIVCQPLLLLMIFYDTNIFLTLKAF